MHGLGGLLERNALGRRGWLRSEASPSWSPIPVAAVAVSQITDEVEKPGPWRTGEGGRRGSRLAARNVVSGSLRHVSSCNRSFPVASRAALLPSVKYQDVVLTGLSLSATWGLVNAWGPPNLSILPNLPHFWPGRRSRHVLVDAVHAPWRTKDSAGLCIGWSLALPHFRRPSGILGGRG